MFLLARFSLSTICFTGTSTLTSRISTKITMKLSLALIFAILRCDCFVSAFVRAGPFKHPSHVSATSPGANQPGKNAESPLVLSTPKDTQELVKSVNYFISRTCNYSCGFCFHTQKNTHMLDIDRAKAGLKLLRAAGTEKINFAGGEPFIHDIFLGELCRYAQSIGMAVSIISNGSLIKPYWMQLYGEYVDVLGVSVDSFHPDTNAAIGRGGDANNRHVDRIFRVRELCANHDIIYKMNTVVCNLNWQQDMSEQVRRLDPKRWKVFQVLILGNENSGRPGELRDATTMTVTDDQFWSFVNRHDGIDCLIPEPNNIMQNSYLLLDEEMRFLDCSSGSKLPTESILDVGVEAALEQAGFDDSAFYKRGGIYEWSRHKKADAVKP